MMPFPLLLICLLMAAMPVQADWNRFRGPNGSGIASGRVPGTWSSSENVIWKAPLPGPGTSSAIVVGSAVLVTCWSGYGDGSPGEMAKLVRHVICLDNTTGQVRWSRAVPAVLPEDPYEGMITEHGYASSTPTSDGEAVYVFFGKTGVLCFDVKAGTQRWHTPIKTHSDDKHWGSAASPVLHGELLIVNALTEAGAVIALDKRTGRQVWQTAEAGRQLAYGTPLLVERAGGGQDVVIPVREQVWGIDAATGTQRWYAAHGLGGDVSPHAILGGGLLYIFGGNPKQGSVALPPGGAGDLTAQLKWQNKNSSYIPTPVYHEGRLYVINDQGFALCMDARTGAELYRERAMERLTGKRRAGGGQPFYASPVLVNGRLYCPSRRNGTFVIAAKPTFELLAINVLADDESSFNATPAVDGNRLYLRSDRFLYCLGE